MIVSTETGCFTPFATTPRTRSLTTWLPRCAIPGSAASARSHGSLAAPSLAPLRPHDHMAPSLRHPWLRCVRTISRLGNDACDRLTDAELHLLGLTGAVHDAPAPVGRKLAI